VVNLWHDEVGGGVPLATGGSARSSARAATQRDVGSSTRAGDGLALLWVSSPARCVHDRWPFAPFSRRFPENRMSLEDLPAHEFQSPRLSSLVARSHRHYKLADTNTQLFRESLPATPQRVVIWNGWR
jgi:hypothetical protein